jgi:hypothetical protein
MSRLRRDRRARAWARYSKRGEELCGGWAGHRACPGALDAARWYKRRKQQGCTTGEARKRQWYLVMSMFYNL